MNYVKKNIYNNHNDGDNDDDRNDIFDSKS